MTKPEEKPRAKYNLKYYEKNKERLVKENYLRSLAAGRVKSPRDSTLSKYNISRQEAEEILGKSKKN